MSDHKIYGIEGVGYGHSTGEYGDLQGVIVVTSNDDLSVATLDVGTLLVNNIPNAPTLLTPLDQETATTTGDVLFEWEFNDLDSWDSQKRYAFKRQRHPEVV